METNNYFMPCCMAIIEQMQSVTINNDKQDLEAIRHQVCHLLDSLDKVAVDNQCNLEVAMMVKYAMVSYVDEWVMLNSGQASNWAQCSLQLEYFNENSAGEGFFTHLDNIMANPKAMLFALEIYYLVLQLGFEGRYRVQDKEKIKFVIAQVHSLLSEVKTKPGNLLIASVPAMDKLEAVSREIPLWVMACVSLASVSVISMTYSLMISHKAQAISESVIAAAKQMGYLVFG